MVSTVLEIAKALSCKLSALGNITENYVLLLLLVLLDLYLVFYAAASRRGLIPHSTVLSSHLSAQPQPRAFVLKWVVKTKRDKLALQN